MTSRAPVHLADQGYFWIGVELAAAENGLVVDGTALYVEYQIPERQTQPYPLVFIHGGGAQGLDWMSTPDGRPGWRTLALQAGYAVYVVDRPGHGRATGTAAADRWTPTVDGLGAMFSGGTNPAATQWPGTGEPDDLMIATVLAGASAGIPAQAEHHRVMRLRGAQLLDRIGPAVVIANSAGCGPAWLMGDARPELVRAIVALEPLSPSMSWAIAESPMSYDPPVSGETELGLFDAASAPADAAASSLFPAGPPPMYRQPEPARRLSQLALVPLAIVTGEASFATALDPATVDYLRRAGCQVDHLRLGDLGINGNGHLAMLEKNNADVLAVVLEWVQRRTRTSPTDN
ncbi:alpha/beta fold hydrolase [Nocardia asteroides]|uniref:alpha/beta fold hydrolase n=1 Tax=Nocardia asteroides TaxID=1824 RepID=UPI0034211970